MANENDKKPEDPPEESNEPAGDETTAENAAERLYDESDAWKRSKNMLFVAMGVIAAAVGIVTYTNRVADENAGERSHQYVVASREAGQAEGRFLAFADEHDDALGSVARYRVAVSQYKDGRFEEAATTFAKAAEELGELPPRGRALLGHGVSLLKAGKTKEGKAALDKLAGDALAPQSDKAEARYLLAVQALHEGDDQTLETQKQSLGGEDGNSRFLERLTRYQKTKVIAAKATSLSERNSERGRAFLEKNKARAGVKALESGLLYEVLVDGNGSVPTGSDEVEVHYHGTLVDGEVFDSSVERGEPSTFGVTGVIKGWTEALQLMKVGSKWKLLIPPDLAYAENGSNSIGPNETLVFEVELLGITEKELPNQEGNATSLTPLVIPEANATVAPDGNTTAPAVVEANASDANGSNN